VHAAVEVVGLDSGWKDARDQGGAVGTA